MWLHDRPHSNGDSRECLGPTSEVSLYRSSTRRVLAGVAVLAVITPAAEAVDASVATAAPASVPAAVETAPQALVIPEFAASVVARTLPVALVELRPRGMASRARAAARRQAKPRPVQKARPAQARPALARPAQGARPAARTESTSRRQATSTSRVSTQRATKRQVTKRVAKQRTTRQPSRSVGARRGMSAVIAFARAQVGKRYSSGASGPNRYDCSGLTMRAYQRAGLRLPHSSGAQAARARTVSRARAVPGDLVVGPGHVGVYMGGGMMVDAGNSRTGVVYRRLYAGLHIERF
jgi:cell wall-associated NlpC family hydrolase